MAYLQQQSSSINFLPLQTRIGFGLGHVFNDMTSSLCFSYILLYMDTVLKFEKYQCGLLMLIGQIADASCNPLFGYLSDRTANIGIFKYGNRKMWHLLGTTLLLLTFPLAFLDLNWTFVSYAVSFAFFQFGWAAVQNSHLALIPELSSTSQGRLKLTSTRFCATVLSNVFVYGVAWYVLSGNKKYNMAHVADNYRNIMLTCCLVGTSASVLFYSLVKEKAVNHSEDVALLCRKTTRDILTDLIYYKTALVYLLTMVFANICQIIMPMYLNHGLDMHGKNLAIIPLCIYLGSFVASFFINKLITSYRRVPVYIFGSCLGLVCCFWIYGRSGIPAFRAVEIYIIAVLFGIASCVLQVTNLDTVAAVIGSKTEDSALVYGLMTFCDKISNGVVVVVIEAMYNHIPSKMYYGNALALVCGCSVVIATPVLVILSKTLTNRGQYGLIL